MANDEVVEAIAAVIAPYVGPAMARSAVVSQARKIGPETQALTPSQVEELLTRVGSGLSVFVGRAKSAVILGEARQAVARVRAR